MTKRTYRYELWQNGIEVAAVEGPDHGRVRSEIWHYAMQYAQDGPCEIRGADVSALMPLDFGNGESAP